MATSTYSHGRCTQTAPNNKQNGNSYQTAGLGAPEELAAEYAALAAAMAPRADLFLAETLSTAAEARAAAAATAPLGKPLWVALTLDDGADALLRSGEALEAVAAELLRRHAHIEAVLVNCCAPAAATAALPRLAAAVAAAAEAAGRRAAPVRFGAYANGFKTTTSEWLEGSGSGGSGGRSIQRTPLPEADAADYDAEGAITPAAYARHARAWRAAGATIIGGCCGVGPAHIRRIAAELGSSGVATS